MRARQVEVLAGGHLVATTGSAVLVVAHRGYGAPTASSPAAVALRALLSVVGEAVGRDPAAPGRAIAKAATQWILTQDDQAEFGVLSDAPNGGTAIFLRGEVTALVTDTSGAVLEFLGAEAGFTTDRIVARPARSMVLLVEGSDGARPPIPAAPGVGSLDQGIAVGAGAVVWPAPDTGQDPAAGHGPAAGQPPQSEQPPGKWWKPGRTPAGAAPGGPPGESPAPPPPRPAPAGNASTEQLDRRAVVGMRPSVVPTPMPSVDTPLAPPSVFASLDPGAPDDDGPTASRSPLPVADPTTSRIPAPGGHAETELGAVGVMVKGHYCARGHINDPRVGFCAVCGLRMDQMTNVLRPGLRPPLGLLVLDDGTTYVLDEDCVLGRDPERSEQARGGMRPIRLDDTSGAMSRVHAEVRLVNWDVTLVDLGSTNGTYVRKPGSLEFTRLQPNQPATLDPGAELRIGPRVISFDSQHGRF